jgi:protein required for attachment to host cells
MPICRWRGRPDLEEARLLIPHGAHIMVVDGARMSLFRNSGRDSALRLDLLDEEEKPSPRSSAMGTDRPGRSRQNLGTAGGAHQGTDFHQMEEDEFAAAAADRLAILLRTESARAVLVAARRSLGIMRKQLGPKLRSRLIAEIDKDFAGRSAQDVAKMLARAEP